MATAKAAKAAYTQDQARKFYETMSTIRHFEESIKHDSLAGEIPGFVHLYIGEEAIATGVCAALRNDDSIESTHRGHGHCIAKGADVNRMMAEIFGKKTGLCEGRGGSMHIADFSVGMLGANGVVGGGYNLATGAALANKTVLKNDKVSVVFFGDGASNRGTFHEAMNVASAWKLPIIFINEMNCWASTTPYRTTCNLENISDRAAGYHIPGVIVDGQDVFAVYDAAVEAVARARRGEGPTFIEAKTYRIEGHFVGDPEMYRTREETQKIFHDTDPLQMFRKKAEKLKLMTAKECEAVDADCVEKIKAAKKFAMESEYPDSGEFMKYVYVD
ncbi:thiamine pyrophosphate-dependent dehydrogenase E1 component subunit alpha [Oscillibacter sp.]|uniref:thiamine pyrophosphate-dependent dehydrogenase E1 component subunit alpha n=1 Tax=Oscillibacter sp. TaxID=1945593 RepID=UPI0028984411|nr:thiamine pyrophosphate-dependent dehydrogenase E1 component subunit alpha [Oscillibacter sp.]